MTTSAKKTVSKAEHRKQALLKHYATLERLAKACGIKSPDGKKLSLALWKLETQAHKASEDYCNGVIEEGQIDLTEEFVTLQVQKLFNNALKGFKFNHDPRGYALKIESEVNADQYKDIGLDRDWGGSGLLSPEIN